MLYSKCERFHGFAYWEYSVSTKKGLMIKLLRQLNLLLDDMMTITVLLACVLQIVGLISKLSNFHYEYLYSRQSMRGRHRIITKTLRTRISVNCFKLPRMMRRRSYKTDSLSRVTHKQRRVAVRYVSTTVDYF